MKNRIKIVIYPFIIIILFSGTTVEIENLTIRHHKGNEYISLYDIIKGFNLDNTYDIISGKGKLYRKSHYAIYSVDFSYILIDGKLYKSEYPVIRKKGEILFPLNSGESIIEILFPEIELYRKGKVLGIKYKKIKQAPDISKKNVINTGKDRIAFVIIDPGHGGKDPGAIGKGGVKEKHITLKIAKYIASSLREKLKGVKILLTRESDRFVELSKRTSIANKYLKKSKNGIFLSIHVNASISKKISGFETYFLSQNPTNEDARNTAALENNVIVLEDKGNKKNELYDDVDYIEAMMLTTQIQKESSLLANSIQSGIRKRIKKFKSRGVRKADFFVLRGALMPAALIEIGFITNHKELQNLKKTSYQNLIARGISDGIAVFIKKYEKLLN